MNLQSFIPFFNAIQKASLPGIWSKGVAFARASAVIQDCIEEDEMKFRIQVSDRFVSPKVTLWPKDEDWFCDCDDRNNVCAHVVAVVIAFKSGQHLLSESTQTKSTRLSYRFTRQAGKLFFDRWIITGEQKEEILNCTLLSFIEGISLGRIKVPMISVTREDYAVDTILTETIRGELDRLTLQSLLKALSYCSNIQLDGQTIQISSKPIQVRAILSEEGTGYRLRQAEDLSITECFSNGAVLCGNLLRGVEIPTLTTEEKRLLARNGSYFTNKELRSIFTEILPSLEKKMKVEILISQVPQIRQVPPRIILQLEADSLGETLTVLPVLICGDDENVLNKNEIWTSDPAAQTLLIRRLKNELQLIPGQRVQFNGEAAVDFVLRIKEWEHIGNGAQAFSVCDSLLPAIDVQGESFDFSFNTGPQGAKADPNRVLKAWRENQNYVPLLSGGWARLPRDWLERYGDRIAEFLVAKNLNHSLPAYFLPELIHVCEEVHQPYPDIFKNLNQLLVEDRNLIHDSKVPDDLNTSLRSYQQKGLNWLCFLRDAKMGAMLADDMGLGKTLQALCAIRGKTLIVCPTSVLYNWADQMKHFRPELSFSIYYGNSRKLDRSFQVILTSYSLLRLDRDTLTQGVWNTVILDEAQTIKNSDSQIAKAVYSLRAEFRLALSGTPFENQLEDLWSQFQFINPGLLGTLDTFQNRFALPISRGDEKAAQILRQRVKPFILRRLKKDVAPELPARTEKVLYCELNSKEREVYDSILLSTRKEVLEKFDTGGGVFGALELLLRLRQACCHISLVPGQVSHQSSKIELLLQSLEITISLGHRALVFSQWTSYLDLIEPHFYSRGITFSRLDGTTKNRGELVAQFQASSGHSVMLISLKAGGVGLTLTAADHIFLMDPWWNPAVEDQAADRAHRIGQINPVLIHRLVAQGTIEERILELQKYKLAMAANVLQESSTASLLTREDILALLKL